MTVATVTQVVVTAVALQAVVAIVMKNVLLIGVGVLPPGFITANLVVLLLDTMRPHLQNVVLV